jgi:adenine-specific DNA-methyltransferase
VCSSDLRDRLKLARELLTESGSCFVQISDENLHHVREIMDEVFGHDNFCAIIPFRKKTMPFGSNLLEQMYDFLLWYSKDKKIVKYHPLFIPKTPEGDFNWRYYKTKEGKVIDLSDEQINNHSLLPEGDRLFMIKPLKPSGVNKSGQFDFEYEGKIYHPPKNGWVTDKEGMVNLLKARRIGYYGVTIGYILYHDDFPVFKITSPWTDVSFNNFTERKNYVVQTATQVIERCMLMTADPGDLVLDPTCGSGTTAYVAEQWGRRWIMCDTSRVAITLAKQRLMTSMFNYYELAHPNEGVSSGFKYKTVKHLTLGSIANNKLTQEETLYNQPLIDKKRKRITGPFTVEAVPSQRVRSFDEIESKKIKQEADNSIARSGETLRQNEWTDELLLTGIRGKGGQKLEFSRIESLPATRFLHAEGETKNGEKVVVSFGPEYAPLEQRQVELAIEEAQKLVPKPKIIVFASFQFDPEAAKDIDELKWPGVTVIKAQMNTDLLTQDLKKKRSSNESFWLIGQPDIEVKKQGQKYIVQVNGFDYYNTKTGEIESGDTSKIAMWELDTDYDGRSLYPRQVFFPIAGENEGWSKLAKNLKAVIDEELIQQYSGNISLPFKAGKNNQIAVKIIDDRGIESLKIIELK